MSTPNKPETPRWPFPIWPNPLDKKGGAQPKFNPANHEDALL
jgi:hypothetical protein